VHISVKSAFVLARVIVNSK